MDANTNTTLKSSISVVGPQLVWFLSWLSFGFIFSISEETLVFVFSNTLTLEAGFFVSRFEGLN